MPWYINGFPYVSFNNTSISMGYLVFYSTSSVDQWMPWWCIQYQQWNNRFPGDIFKIICISMESLVFHSTTSVYINGFPCVSLNIISISIDSLKSILVCFSLSSVSYQWSSWYSIRHHQSINGVPIVFHSITSVYINGFPCVSLSIICILISAVYQWSPWCFIE